MPRPKRDYGKAIRDDIAKLDAKIQELAVRRSKLVTMLTNYEADTSVDIASILRDVTSTKPSARRRRTRH